MKKREKMKQKFLVLISSLAGIFMPGSLAQAYRQKLVIRPYENVGELYGEDIESEAAACTETEREKDKIVPISKGKEEKIKAVTREEDKPAEKLSRRKKVVRKMKAAVMWISKRKLIIRFRRIFQSIGSGFRRAAHRVRQCPVFHRPRRAAAA